MPIPATSFSNPLSRMALSTALQQAAQRRAVLPELPADAQPRTPAEVAHWACEGFNVQPLIRHHADREMSPDQYAWGKAFVASLAVKWIDRMNGNAVSDEALADRWVCATQMLSDGTRVAGLGRLNGLFQHLEAIRREQDELRAIMGTAPGPADFGRRTPRL